MIPLSHLPPAALVLEFLEWVGKKREREEQVLVVPVFINDPSVSSPDGIFKRRKEGLPSVTPSTSAKVRLFSHLFLPLLPLLTRGDGVARASKNDAVRTWRGEKGVIPRRRGRKRKDD